MSGPFGSQQWMYSTGFYPYEIDQSLRFNDDDSAYLSRTPASAGNRKTFTYSCWVKRSTINTAAHTFGITAKETSNNARTEMEFDGTANEINIGFNPSGSQWFESFTNPVFRDVSAWYHVVVSVDMTQATDTDRLKVYVNGVLQTFRAYSVPSQNTDLPINNNIQHSIGRYESGGTSLLDGYLAEVNFIDGQALDPTSFGEFKSGVWIPKSYSGSYGTNGFYLDFGNSGSLGADSSGNGNNWTPNNLAATDQVIDSPTNNFCTLNPLRVGSNLALSEGNLKNVASATGNKVVSSSFGVTTGKWYWEFALTSSPEILIGIENGFTSLSSYLGQTSNSWGYDSANGDFYHAGSGSAYGDTFTTNDVIGVAVDVDSGNLWFSKNGTWQNSGSPTAGTNPAANFSGTTGGTIFPAFTPYASGASGVANFGQDSSFAGNKTAQGNTDANGIGDFYYAPPAGYLALCTANLPDPAIDPAQDDVPEDYFNTVLYTGNGTGQSITGVNFQPDLVWIKSRSDVDNNVLQDGVRGATKQLFSNLTDAETSFTNGVTSFDSDGFTVATSNWSNENGQTRVAWNWLAGNGTSSNTDGTITSTVSANQKAGFSIVSYTGTGTSGATVGHGLSQAPEMVINKNRSVADDWSVYTDTTGTGQKLLLNSTAAVGGTSNYPSAPTSSVFTIGAGVEVNGSGNSMIAYCFHSVEGFSKFGSYTGNGSTDGPFVYTGFRPAFVLWKNAGGTENWHILDTVRDDHNVADHLIRPNLSNAEAFLNDGQGIDILSNGFKPKVAGGGWINASGNTFIYMAFAEMPFKYANAR